MENPQKLVYMRVHDGSTRSSIEQKYEYWIPASSVRELPWREGTLTDIRREPIEFVGDIEACDCVLDLLRPSRPHDSVRLVGQIVVGATAREHLLDGVDGRFESLTDAPRGGSRRMPTRRRARPRRGG